MKLMREKEALREELLPVFRLAESAEEIGRELSFAQERLWFLHTSSSENPFYNEPVLLEMTGTVDHQALAASLTTIRQRHEILRTHYIAKDGVPTQVVYPVDNFPIEFIHMHDASRSEIDRKIADIYRSEASLSLDLATDSLCRAIVISETPRKHHMVFFMHHIISDGWSMGVMLKELVSIYGSMVEGLDAALPALPIQYADHAVWEKTVLTGGYLETLNAFWKRELSGASERISLPRKTTSTRRPSYKGDRISINLSESITGKVLAFTQEQGSDITLFMSLMSAFYIALNYVGGDSDISVGTDFANRPNTESEQLIGFFVNQLVLRAKLAEDRTFRELLLDVRDICNRAYDNHMLPFDRLVELLNHDRMPGVTPVFQVKLVLQNTPLPPLELPDLQMTPKPIARGSAKFDLLLDLTVRDSRLSGWLEYSLDCITPETANRMFSVFVAVLTCAIDDPELSLGEIKSKVKLSERDSRRRERGNKQRKLPVTRRV